SRSSSSFRLSCSPPRPYVGCSVGKVRWPPISLSRYTRDQDELKRDGSQRTNTREIAQVAPARLKTFVVSVESVERVRRFRQPSLSSRGPGRSMASPDSALAKRFFSDTH